MKPMPYEQQITLIGDPRNVRRSCYVNCIHVSPAYQQSHCIESCGNAIEMHTLQWFPVRHHWHEASSTSEWPHCSPRMGHSRSPEAPLLLSLPSVHHEAALLAWYIADYYNQHTDHSPALFLHSICVHFVPTEKRQGSWLGLRRKGSERSLLATLLGYT